MHNEPILGKSDFVSGQVNAVGTSSHFETQCSYRYEVSAADIDELGHASNISVVRWIQDAAITHSSSAGLDFAGYKRLGAIFVVRRHEIDYLRSPVRGDVLRVRTWVASAKAASMLRMTEFTRERDATTMATAQTTWAFIDLASGRPRRIPEDLRRLFVPDAPGVATA